METLLGISFAIALALSNAGWEQDSHIIQESGREDRTFQRWDRDPWYVLAGDDYCAAGLHAGNMQFAIEKYWWTGEVRVQVLSRRWLSLARRSGTAANLDILIDGTPAWSTSDAEIVGNHEVGGFVAQSSDRRAVAFPARLAAGRTIGLSADGILLGNYDLEGAAEAIEALNACVVLMRHTDQRDPFSGRR